MLFASCSRVDDQCSVDSLSGPPLHKFGTEAISCERNWHQQASRTGIHQPRLLLTSNSLHHCYTPNRCFSGNGGMTHAGKSFARASLRKAKSLYRLRFVSLVRSKCGRLVCNRNNVSAMLDSRL
jgi:hypothetical protein